MEEEIPRSERPHHATVTMKIDVREMTQSGDILHSVIGDKDLNKYGLSRKAMYFVTGATEAGCLKQLKECLERLNG
tara:strand:- start:328 stop:555 length:228 start_codon:yes stop_codon:yes gene_type:complete